MLPQGSYIISVSFQFQIVVGSATRTYYHAGIRDTQTFSDTTRLMCLLINFTNFSQVTDVLKVALPPSDCIVSGQRMCLSFPVLCF